MESPSKFKCMDVESWRAFTKLEMRTYLEEMRKRTNRKDESPHYKTILAVRQQLSPVDMYCYLKARFSGSNGFQNLLRSDSSDNWIHWDFNLKADGEDVYISGTYCEVHFMLTEELADADWPVFLEKIKSDFGHVGREKS